jgi:hypothetical protein
VGKDGWKNDFHIFELLLFLPDFVEWLFQSPVSIIEEVVGSFHLG